METVHTNRMGGAWKHAKDHINKMGGIQYTLFMGHMAEIMWRDEAKGNTCNSFYDLRSIYSLDRDPKYHHSTPLIDTLVDPSSSVEDIMVHPAPNDALQIPILIVIVIICGQMVQQVIFLL